MTGHNIYGSPRLSDDELLARIEALNKKSRGFGVSAGVFTTVVIILAVFFLSPMLIIIGIIVGVSISSAGWYRNYKLIKVMLSENIVRGALDEVMQVEALVHDWHIIKERIRMTGLIDSWNRCKGSDYVRGKYRGYNIEFSDIHLEEYKQRGKSSTYVTKFKGQWIICELDKPINGMVRLREREQVKSGFFGGRGMKSDVETENSSFNEQFQILTTNPHTAFLILTPHFMDYITAMDRRAGARTYMCFMQDSGKSYVCIALHNNYDLFEIKRKERIDRSTFPMLRERIKQEIRYITGTIDELMKNEYLFNKEG